MRIEPRLNTICVRVGEPMGTLVFLHGRRSNMTAMYDLVCGTVEDDEDTHADETHDMIFVQGPWDTVEHGDGLPSWGKSWFPIPWLEEQYRKMPLDDMFEMMEQVASELIDTICASARWHSDQPQITLIGHSQGGMLLADMLQRRDNPWKQVIIFGGCCIEQCLPNKYPTVDRLVKVRRHRVPVTFIHDKRDSRVYYDNVVASVEPLRKAGHDVNLLTSFGGHNLSKNNILDIFEKIK